MKNSTHYCIESIILKYIFNNIYMYIYIHTYILCTHNAILINFENI